MEQIRNMQYNKDKAIRLFFLMAFGTPLGCSEGEKTSYIAYDRRYYLHDGTPFAVELFNDAFSIRSMLTTDAQLEWMLRMPIKEFKMFGKVFKKQ